jgi:hypothetical protein
MRKLLLLAGAWTIVTLAAEGAARAQDPNAPLPPGMNPAPPPQGEGEVAPAPTDESKDSGVGLKWVWAGAELGGSYTNMKAFSQSNLAVVDTTKSGLMTGFGAGVRLLFLDVGLRVRDYTALSMWNIDGEVRFHMRMGRVDPSLAVRGGYSTVGNFDQSVGSATGTAQVDVHGFNVGTGFRLDYLVGNFVVIGVELSGDVLFLTRPVPPLPPELASLPPAQQAMLKAQLQSEPLYQNSGDSVGFGAALGAHLGVHF